ncbi:murein transglycosylase A [Hyphomonas sp.]|uniref:murein transglycosylase A n=1 Tax=Hyphomonas sp. TaxID=87 RepID=UPI00391CF1BC
MRLTRLIATASLLIAAACQSTPPPVAPPHGTAPPPVPGLIHPPPASTPATYHDLPGWHSARLAPALEAFRRTCDRFTRRAWDAPLSQSAPWAGTAEDWAPACASLSGPLDDASARRVIESLFVPVEIIDNEGRPRFTGYFEPTYQARRAPEPGFTEPVMALPPDFVANGNAPLQRLPNGTTRPYPPRAEITERGGSAIAWAHPSDVFFLQIQGSGRLIFPDGTTMRAGYAAHNGQPFRSVANWLIETGRITRGEGSMQGIRAWMDRSSLAEVRQAMNINPRFVFFQALPEGDPTLGPVGAHNVPLTALGSMAVDPAFHALGVPMFVETTAPGLGGRWSGLMIAQDTGGAIKGPVRGDIYFGTGDDAGNRAGTMNAPGRLWVLLPRAVANRLYRSRPVAAVTGPPGEG